MKRLVLPLLLLIVLSLPMLGGVDGQWVVPIPGNAAGLILELKSDGNRLTGSLAGPRGKLEIVNGSAVGDIFSFETVSKAENQSITVKYRGRRDADSLELVVQASGDGPEQKFIATRCPAGAGQPDWFSDTPAPGEVLAWLKANAIGLKSIQPSPSFADMEPLVGRLKDARVVGVGEATHGTREFQQFKVRMLQFLVQKLDVTIFGIEANWPETLDINEFVLTGKGDLNELLNHQFLWWRSEEVRDMILWMRKYNQDTAHPKKLKFYGFDMQAPGLAESNVLRYLARVDAAARNTVSKAFSELGVTMDNPAYERSSPEAKQRTASVLAETLKRFDERKAAYIRASSLEEWTLARQNMVIVTQAEVKLGNQGEAGRAFRDRAMADNIKWILDHEPGGARMMLWAHNGHVATEGPNHLPMGGNLRRLFNGEYVNFGFVFGAGSFRAIDMATGQDTVFSVADAPAGSLDATLASPGLPAFLIDLRSLPQGVVADWFNSSRRSRQIGGGYLTDTPGVWLQSIHPARAFDFLIFIGKTEPSTSL